MAQALSEKLEHTGPAEKERVASVPQRESSRQARRSRPCQKEKEQSRYFPGGSRRKRKRVSGRKGSPGRSAKFWFHSKSGQT